MGMRDSVSITPLPRPAESPGAKSPKSPTSPGGPMQAMKASLNKLRAAGGAVMHVMAAAPKRDKHVRCVLRYRKKPKDSEEEVKEYELETLGDHTTWARLVERCVHVLWPNNPKTENTVVMLEFTPLCGPAAEPEIVYIIDTNSLLRALAAFRDTYDLRKSNAIARVIGEVEGLMRAGDPEGVARGARMIQDLMQTSIDAETQKKLLGLLTDGLQQQRDHENGARDALERARGVHSRAIRRPKKGKKKSPSTAGSRRSRSSSRASMSRGPRTSCSGAAPSWSTR